MRRLALALAALALVAAVGCQSSTSDGHHWPRTTGTETQIHVDVPDWAETTETPIRAGLTAWDTSPHLDITLVRTCPPTPTNCVTIRASTDLASPSVGVAQISAAGDHILSGWIQFDAPCLTTCDPATLTNTACHELGHDLGLYHGTTPGPCVNGRPTRHDLDLIALYYNHPDTPPTGTPIAQETTT